MILGVSVAAQTLLFFKSMLLGACLMVLYDLFRILRIAVPTPSVVIMVEDLLYCAICAVATFVFMVSANFGEIRFFTLLGEALGAVLCALTVSRLLLSCSKVIISFVKGIGRLVWKVFLRPVYLLVHWIAGVCIKIVNFFAVLMKKSLNRANFGLKRRRIMMYNLIKSGRGKKKEPPAGKTEKKRKNKADRSRRGVKKHELQKCEDQQSAHVGQ